MSTEQEMVTITAAEYNDLLDESCLLSLLRAAGVDNWDGYDYAIDAYNEENGE